MQAYFMDKQYRRAHNLLKSSGLAESDPRGCHLAACCLAEIKDWEGCLTLLGGWDSEDALAKYKKQVAPVCYDFQISILIKAIGSRCSLLQPFSS